MTKDEEILLRELAGGRCTIQKVTAAIGPMSLWSKAGLEAEIRKAVEAEREACAKVCEAMNKYMDDGEECATAIRARGDNK
jgi:phosphoserine phosphatase